MALAPRELTVGKFGRVGEYSAGYAPSERSLLVAGMLQWNVDDPSGFGRTQNSYLFVQGGFDKGQKGLGYTSTAVRMSSW